MFNKLFISFFGSGFIRPASATWGTLACMPFAYVYAVYFPPITLLIISVILLFTGWWAVEIYEKQYNKHDPSEVVIDEVAAVLIPLAFIEANWLWYVYVFFAFRFFDILKPFPARRFDNMKSPFSVMIDDTFAALYTLGSMYIAQYVYYTYIYDFIIIYLPFLTGM